MEDNEELEFFTLLAVKRTQDLRIRHRRVSNNIPRLFAKFYVNKCLYWNVIAIFHFQGWSPDTFLPTFHPKT